MLPRDLPNVCALLPWGSCSCRSHGRRGYRSLPRSLAATNPQLELSYGITNSFEFELYVTELAFWASGNNQPAQSSYGLGDTTMFVKYRTLIQQPDSWQPTLTPTFY